MKFTRADNYFEKSDCGKYTVAATCTIKTWLFGAWRLGPPHVLLGNFVKADDARNACAMDAESVRKVA